MKKGAYNSYSNYAVKLETIKRMKPVTGNDGKLFILPLSKITQKTTLPM